MVKRFDREKIRRGHEETKIFTSVLATNFGGLSLLGKSANFGGLSMLGISANFEGVSLLEEIRCAGNEAFAHEDWTEAVRAYSVCIDMGTGAQLKINRSDEEEYKRVIMLAFSNRAEAKLRLRDFESALEDANEALQIEPKHVKTLVRKGKAAQGLALYEKACETFKLALDESPEEESIVKLLRDSSVAQLQSQIGYYDLTDFSSGGIGEIPFCADFVGPVEIRRRSDGDGGWGLFATKRLKSGELLLVSNPLAVIWGDVKWEETQITAYGSVEDRDPLETVVDLTRDLAYQILISKRQMAQLYSLGSHKELEMGFPWMELFRPGSDWLPPGAEKLQLDMNPEMEFIYDIAKKKRFQYTEVKGPNDKGGFTHVTGLWALPAFAKHSCAPNCQHVFVGNALFIRASGHIMKGEELTVAYFNDLDTDVVTRQSFCESWMFKCKCDRCVFEESIQPQLSNVNKQFSKMRKQHLDLMDAAMSECSCTHQVMDNKRTRSALKKRAVATDNVEAVIQSFGKVLLPQQQGWIRAAFLPLYMSKLELAVFGHDYPSRMTSAKLLIDSITSVYITPKTLTYCAMLLAEAECEYSKASQPYKDTLDGVLRICRVIFGNQPDTVLINHIRARIPRDHQELDRPDCIASSNLKWVEEDDLRDSPINFQGNLISATTCKEPSEFLSGQSTKHHVVVNYEDTGVKNVGRTYRMFCYASNEYQRRPFTNTVVDKYE